MHTQISDNIVGYYGRGPTLQQVYDFISPDALSLDSKKTQKTEDWSEVSLKKCIKCVIHKNYVVDAIMSQLYYLYFWRMNT